MTAHEKESHVEKLRVVIAEDHGVIRRFVCALLGKDFQVVSAVENGEQLVEAAILFSPDVIVSDIAMPAVDGLLARKQLLRNGIRIPFVFMTLLDSVTLPANRRDAPIAFVHKMDLPDELKLAIWAVSDGRPYFSKSFQHGPEDQD